MNGSNGIGVGVASVLVIVVVLTFATFSILSLSTANAELTLSRKAVTFSQEWYAAEQKMQNRLAEIDEKIASGEDVFSGGELQLSESVGEGQELQAVLRPGENGYSIVWYGLVNTTEWQPQSGANVWEGAG